MFLQRIIRVSEIAASAAVLTLALVPGACCQTNTVQEDELRPSDEIEESVVYRQKSMTQLRLERHRAQESFFSTFNSLNSKKVIQLRVRIRRAGRKPPAATRMHPVFAKKLRAQAASDMVIANMQYSSTPLGARLRKKEKLMWKEMADLVAEQPEMQAAYVNLVDANRGMDTERQRRCEDRRVLCKT